MCRQSLIIVLYVAFEIYSKKTFLKIYLFFPIVPLNSSSFSYIFFDDVDRLEKSFSYIVCKTLFRLNFSSTEKSSFFFNILTFFLSIPSSLTPYLSLNCFYTIIKCSLSLHLLLLFPLIFKIEFSLYTNFQQLHITPSLYTHQNFIRFIYTSS